uniref:Uncharacterized protein n=1 Tax=Anopheles dirus TaxID=7168 RepID=A0A182NRK2_9DIPT
MRPRGPCHLAPAVLVVWLLSSVACGQDYGSESNSKEATVSKYDNHLNASEAFLDSAELTSGYSQVDPVESPFYRNHQFHCQACQYRSVYAMASLKSIKAHVLMKLGIDLLPNRTRYPEVPQHILSSFLDQQSYQRSTSSVRDGDYMEDDPSVGVEDPEEDYDYYPITNKIYILANRE